MNAVKRTARKRHYRKQFGPGHEVLADNRNFQKKGKTPADRSALRDHILGKLNHAKNEQRAKAITFIEANRDSVDLSYSGGTFVGFHDNLTEKSDGQLLALAMLLARVKETQKSTT